MKYAKYEYGMAVAFYDGPAIRFGVIEEIVCREKASGETVEYVVTHQDGQSIRREEVVAEIETGTAYTAFDKMLQRHPARKWAIDASARLLDPKPEPEAPIVTDSTSPAAVPPADPITADGTF